jgi:hypothetical protein
LNQQIIFLRNDLLDSKHYVKIFHTARGLGLLV